MSLTAFYDEELIEAGNNRLKLGIDFRTLDIAEHLIGEKTPDILPKLFSPRPSVGASAKFLWALLRRHHDAVTIDQAGGLVVSEHSAGIFAAIFALLSRALNLGSSEAKDKNPPKRRGALKPS